MPALFSIITPVYDTPAEVLSATFESVRAQSYPHWEWCLVDDASPSPHLWPLVQRFAAADSRVRIERRPQNGGISRASNDALAMASGEFVAFLDHDDVLVKDALAFVNHDLSFHGPWDFCYSDEAKLLPSGRLSEPFYKPDWSPERMRSHMYTGRFAVMRRSLVEEVGGFRPAFDGSQDYDLVLRVTERTDRIHHVTQMLYLRRVCSSSAAGEMAAKSYALDAGLRAVQDHCDRVGIDAVVEMLPIPGHHRVRRHPCGQPLVSIVIPTRGSSARVHGTDRVHVLHTVRSVVDRSTYTNVECVVVADDDCPVDVIAELERVCGDRLRLVRFSGPFNYSAKVNAGVVASSGEVLVLLNDDIAVVTPDWIEILVSLVQNDDCGMVGCKLLLADGSLQHGGHVYAAGQMFHAYFHYAGDEPGMANLLRIERECSGVTAACAALRREVWEEVGGMCEDLPVKYNDVDLSLKVRQLGLRVVWTPHAVLYHFEALSRVRGATPSELAFVSSRWGHVLHRDPYFNPNLDQTRGDWVVEIPPEAWLR